MDNPLPPLAESLKAAARSSTPLRLRLAPTPSGWLHIGNALNFVFVWLLGRCNPHNHLLLRIDDLDGGRKRPEYVQDVFDTLHWLGLDWDEGPQDAIEFEACWTQLHRLDLYERFLNDLRENGHLFPCKKSRRDLIHLEGAYPNSFRQQAGVGFDDPDVTWRIRTPDDFPLPDFIVRGRSGLPAYQLSSLVDDLFFHINCVVRGADLQVSTQAQQFLAQCIGANAAGFNQVVFIHHALIMYEEGRKLSKSEGATALRTVRRAGQEPSFVFQKSAEMLGFEGDFRTASALLDAFKAYAL